MKTPKLEQALDVADASRWFNSEPARSELALLKEMWPYMQELARVSDGAARLVERVESLSKEPTDGR